MQAKHPVAAGLAALLCAAAAPGLAQDQMYFHMGTGRLLEAEKGAEARIRTDADRTTRNLAPLCLIYYKLRRYSKLADCATRLEQRIAAGDATHSDFLVFPSNAAPLPPALRASMALEFGQPAKAIEEARIARSRIGEDDGTSGLFSPGQYMVDLLPIVGIAYSLLGDRAGLERTLKELEDLEIPYIGGQQRSNLREVGLAQLKINLGRYKEALGHLDFEHHAFARGIADLLLGGGDSFGTVYELPKALMAARCHFELGAIEEAKLALDALLGHKSAPEHGDIYWIALYERGRVAEREGKPAEAIDYYRRAIEVIELQRASLTTEATKIGFVGNKQQVYARAVALLVGTGQAGDAFDYVERSKARALVDMLAQKSDFALRGAAAPRLRESLAELDRTQVAAQSLAGPAGGLRSVRVLQDAIRSADPELSSLVSVSSVPAATIGALLEADETLVEYYYDDSAAYAFVLSATGVQAVPLERKGLTEEVTQLRRAIELPPGDGYRTPAQALYARLIAPLEAQLAGGKLAIVAHAALHYVPFAALVAPDGRYVVDRWSLRTVPSASVLSFLRPGKAASGRVLALGNPDLGDATLDLAFAEAEARTVASLFPESRVLLRLDASETGFRRDSRQFSRIHFATHGKFRADSPLDSGLYLAKDASNDGVLRVAELYTMELDADLVTLSACETALGSIGSGDDVVGLTRGFLYAGARSIVSTLWSVDDKATAELMRAFYGNLAGSGKREALRQAQLKTRDAFPHPFFWAAFQLVGRPD
ncbi:MAG: CHAT domain-containing protein [Burkholderiales bacterium]